MAYIIRNNVKYAGGSGSGSGNTNSVELTQAEYDELLEADQVDQTIAYFITDSEEPNIVNDLVNIIYPIGSIYMSVNNVSPTTLFGGTWEQIKDTFLLSAGDTYSGGSTGGEATHTLTVNEMPYHYHVQQQQVSNNGITAVVDKVVSGPYAGTAGPEQSGWYTANAAITTQGSGRGESHNNMPPYLTVYVWKRIA